MLKNSIKIVNKKGLHYIADERGKPVKMKPWLGDAFSFLYDFIMRKSIFPQKFGADIDRHEAILRSALKSVHGKRVLELATGSGGAASFLPSDIRYTGTDISPGLLRRAAKRFRNAGFQNATFYVTNADDLPFDDGFFNFILCILSLNFFEDIDQVMKEIKRVSAPGAVFICCVPVPERKRTQSKIRGTLHSQMDLEEVCRDRGLDFKSISADNGALFYFKANIPDSKDMPVSQTAQKRHLP